MRKAGRHLVLLVFIWGPSAAQERADLSGFDDGAHHWYDIRDEDKIITPLPDRPRYGPTETRKIADNILRYQKSNGGWPKNYDMRAILTEAQEHVLDSARDMTNTTFDNGATHSQIEFLAHAFQQTGEVSYRAACLAGIDFVLDAQYPNGGWPQFFPDTTGYRKHITFNDGAMVGVMKVLQHVLQRQPHFGFVDSVRRERVQRAWDHGLDCILACQVVRNEIRVAWGQQHDFLTLRPVHGRAFEPPCLASRETAEIVSLLMSIERPAKAVTEAIEGAVEWLRRSRLSGIRVKEFPAPVAHFKYRTVDFDRMVVEDPSAPPIWARMYDLSTNAPLFCNRDGIPVSSLAEVERERRTGYTWYTETPAGILEEYSAWESREAARR